MWSTRGRFQKSVRSLPPNARRADTKAAAAAIVVGVTAFCVYRAALLPGFDFGDTGSFQTTVGSWLLTPRVGYPLYFAIANAWLRVVGGDPAHALNLLSAVEGSIALGVAVLVARRLSGSLAAAVAAVAMFGVSYTFWSQAIIAEVYSLHIMFVAITLLLLLRWSEQPTVTRLALFFSVYALGFGNHLSMVLLLPAYTMFLLIAAPPPDGWRTMVTPRVVLLALACAIAGALQYAWNIRSMWYLPQPPHNLADAIATFWFDVTKSDWRDTMVMDVPRSMLADHGAMYWFDLRQQFGAMLPILAAFGIVELGIRTPRRAVLMALLYIVNLAFAFSYNVGDAHVFYLPSHFILALLLAPGVVLVGRLGRSVTPIAAAALVAYSGSRLYRDFPALDRSGDTRPAAVVAALTTGLDDQHAVLLTDLNWQIANGLSYFGKVSRPEVAYARAPDVLLYAPALVDDNRAIGREVVLTDRAQREMVAAYGPLLPTAPDPRTPSTSLASRLDGVPPGTPYVLCVLKPSRDLALDTVDVGSALRTLTGGVSTSLPDGDYATVAGLTGRPPILAVGSNLPFTKRVQLNGTDVDVRMEAWLSSDTIRRMGFGHVIAARQHTLIVERGVSFVAFDGAGRPIRTAYASNIFAPQVRYLIRGSASSTPDTPAAATGAKVKR